MVVELLTAWGAKEMWSAFLGKDLAEKVAQKIIINAGFSGALSLLHRDAETHEVERLFRRLKGFRGITAFSPGLTNWICLHNFLY
ncbi:MAG: hypothetical protein ACTFAK_10080 [Candidatus Electronema sp. VV]